MARASEVPPPSDNSVETLRRLVLQLNAQIRALQQQIDALKAAAAVVLVFVFVGVARAQTDTPTSTATETPTITQTPAPCEPFKLKLPNPDTNPPSQAWAKSVISKLNSDVFANSCGGGGGGGGSAFACDSVQTAACADSGDGNPGAVTLDPAACFVVLTVNDADGCLVTISEASATAGALTTIIVAGSGFARYETQAGVLFITHRVTYSEVGQTLDLRYDGSQWNQDGGNDPNSIALSVHSVESGGDFPDAARADECVFLCSDLGGSPRAYMDFQGNGPVPIGDCTCPGTGAGGPAVGSNCPATNTGSICVGGGGAGSTGDHCVALGNALDCSGSAAVAIGDTATASADRCVVVNGLTCSADKCLAFGAGSVCSGTSCVAVGDTAACDTVGGVAIGAQTISKGGIAIGNGAQNTDDSELSFGSTSNPVNPRVESFPVSPSDLSACGGGPSMGAFSNNVAGDIIIGAGGPPIFSCTLTFPTPWVRKPRCFAYDTTNPVVIPIVATTTTTLTITSTADMQGDTISYGCPVS